MKHLSLTSFDKNVLTSDVLYSLRLEHWCQVLEHLRGHLQHIALVVLLRSFLSSEDRSMSISQKMTNVPPSVD